MRGRPAAEASAPIRTCVGCGKKAAQAELLRVRLGPGGLPSADLASRRSPGRGAYLCGEGCLQAAVKRRAFARAFRGEAKGLDPAALQQELRALSQRGPKR